MRARLLLAACLLLAPAAAAQGTVERGERVDVQQASWPAFAVADRPFHVNVTVQNQQAQDWTVLVFATLYADPGGTPCEGQRALQSLSKFKKSVTLGPRERQVVDGAAAHWVQLIEGARLRGAGAYEVCTWLQPAQVSACPGSEPCFLDFLSRTLDVRLANGAPSAQLRVEPARGSPPTTFAFAAEASDPDGDRLTSRWDFGDGQRAEGERVGHRFAREGTYTVRLNVSDGWDSVEREARVVVQGAAGGAPTPWPGAMALAALAFAALTARASRGPR